MTFVRPPLSAAVAALLLAVSAVPVVSANDHASEMRVLREQEKQRTNIYKAYAPDARTARKAAITFHANLLESNYDEGFLVLELSPQEIATLRSFGFRIEHAPEFIQKRDDFLTQIQQAADARQRMGATSTDATVQSIPGFSCYETVEETFTAAQNFATSFPNLATWLDVGDSWQKTQGLGGYDMRVLKITNSAIGGTKPKLFITSAIHAREYTTAPLSLEFARWLINGYGNDPEATWIVDHHEIHLMLQTNPDGRKKAEGGLSWRKNTNTNYCGATSNSRGADLNRNFTFGWNSTGGSGSSGNQCDETYRGPSAGSEPEVQAVQNYIRSIFPDRRGPNPNDGAPADTMGMHIDIHSYSQLVLWPWGTTSTPTANGTALQTLGRRLAYFNGYTPEQSIGLYATDGTSDGPSYGELGVAAFTIELGSSFFESCSTYTSSTKPKNLPALIYAAKVIRAPYQIPAGADVLSLTLSNDASGGGVTAGTPVTVSASATDTRFNNSNGTEPTQTVTGAEAYIDTPPWSSGAVAIPLAASDGSFNSSTEGITGTLSTSGLSLGKHLVFVRAKVASGQWGPVTAQFLKIVNVTPPGNNETEPNDSRASANAVSTPGTWNGNMGSSTDSDYFVVNLPAGKTLTSTLTPNTSSDYDLYVYDSAGTQLGKSEKGTGAVDTVTLTNSTGASVQRFVRVKYYGGGTGATNGKYTLGLSW
ncbi:carboxypeptidase [Albitalea terrae]|uniref:Carboxypeptidase n=2 Tax=Piscinibacter terrae TaxID=2496871 RepID=A0A3N7JPV4_9BURK|nr:carboxypeptidase [Albitalea terrae]